MRAAVWKRFTSGAPAALIATLLVAPAAAQGGAASDPLAAASAAYEAGELDQAATLFRAAIETGGLEPAQLARAHARSGVLAAAGGDLDALAAAYRRALALEPALPTPEELGPDAAALIDELRRERDGRPLSLRLRPGRVPARGTSLPVELVLLDTPAEWAARVRFEGETWARGFAVASATTAVLVREEAWQDAELALTVTLMDAHGNVLAREPLELTRAPALPAVTAPLAAQEPTTRVAPPTGPEWYESPLLWVLVGVVVVGAAVGIGLGVALSPHEIVVGTPSVSEP